MAEAAIKFLRIDNFTTNVGACTNILSFEEDVIMEITPQFVPNTFKGVDVKQDHKWFQLTVVVDSETDIFDAGIDIIAANDVFAGVFYVEFTLADGAGTVERWTYQSTHSYIMNRREGKIDDDTARDTIEYVILTYGSRVVTHP